MITALRLALNRSPFSKVKKVLRFGYNITTTLSELQDPKAKKSQEISNLLQFAFGESPETTVFQGFPSPIRSLGKRLQIGFVCLQNCTVRVRKQAQLFCFAFMTRPHGRLFPFFLWVYKILHSVARTLVFSGSGW